MRRSTILLLDCDEADGSAAGFRKILQASFGEHRIVLETLAGADALRAGIPDLVSRRRPALVFLILSSSRRAQAAEILRVLGEGDSPPVPVVPVLDAGDPTHIFSLLQSGAADFVSDPLSPADVLPRAWRFVERAEAVHRLDRTLREKVGLRQLIGESPAFLAEARKVPVVARYDAAVLITGETGTGKEMFARAIHYLSPRAHKPFVPINCGAIPLDLVESEIFGHTKGAYTGASAAHLGLIGEAEGGTILLDEIDCLPLLSQVKLLRFLQDKQYRSVGSPKQRIADVRVIAATNVDIERALDEGRVRRDLYYRLNVVPITLPPLRERREDIPLLVRHFLSKYAGEFDRPHIGVAPEAMETLLLHDWPGNVRELEHCIERAVVLSEGESLTPAAIASQFRQSDAGHEPFKTAKSRVVTEFEKSYIKGLLLTHHGNISKSAHAAQKNRRAFFQLIRKHGIDVDDFR